MVARVAVVGSINLDLVVGTAALPQPGETVIGGELQRFGGGKGANQALAAARMGADVALIGRVGRDDFGDLVLDDLGRGGVDLSGVTRSEAATGVAMITVDREGMNTIVVAPGANGQLGAAEIETARVRIESSQVLLLQLEVPMEATLRAAQLGRAAGVTLFLNPSPAQPLPDELLRGLDYLVLNERELHVMTEGTGDPTALLDRGVGSVVLTLGERGARLISRTCVRDVAPFRVRSVDSTAAGDAFLGALAATLPQRGIDGALRAASAAGALATTRWGAQAALPTIEEVDAFLERGGAV